MIGNVLDRCSEDSGAEDDSVVSSEGLIFEDALERDRHVVDLKNVSFGYSTDEAQILRSVNLSISKQDIIGIIGKSGSGKSTLINVLLGLLPISSGGYFFRETDVSGRLRHALDQDRIC